MPIWIQPTLRALQEAEEAAGIIHSLNSVAVTQKLTAEAAATVVKPVPVQQTRILKGTVVKAS
jgi:hypothetical protein